MRNHLINEDKENVQYVRFPHIFFPSDDATAYLAQFDLLKQHQDINSLFDMASQAANIKGRSTTTSPAECQQAFEQRYDLVRKLASRDCGLVDIVDLI
jgi:hypothetical protein